MWEWGEAAHWERIHTRPKFLGYTAACRERGGLLPLCCWKALCPKFWVLLQKIKRQSRNGINYWIRTVWGSYFESCQSLCVSVCLLHTIKDVEEQVKNVWWSNRLSELFLSFFFFKREQSIAFAHANPLLSWKQPCLLETRIIYFSHREEMGVDGGRAKHRTLTPENRVCLLTLVFG